MQSLAYDPTVLDTIAKMVQFRTALLQTEPLEDVFRVCALGRVVARRFLDVKLGIRCASLAHEARKSISSEFDESMYAYSVSIPDALEELLEYARPDTMSGYFVAAQIVEIGYLNYKYRAVDEAVEIMLQNTTLNPYCDKTWENTWAETLRHHMNYGVWHLERVQDGMQHLSPDLRSRAAYEVLQFTRGINFSGARD